MTPVGFRSATPFVSLGEETLVISVHALADCPAPVAVSVTRPHASAALGEVAVVVTVADAPGAIAAVAGAGALTPVTDPDPLDPKVNVEVTSPTFVMTKRWVSPDVDGGASTNWFSGATVRPAHGTGVVYVASFQPLQSGTKSSSSMLARTVLLPVATVTVPVATARARHGPGLPIVYVTGHPCETLLRRP